MDCTSTYASAFPPVNRLPSEMAILALKRRCLREGGWSAKRKRIMSKRDTIKYDFKVGQKIVHSGITKDLDRREQEHQQRWPSGHIVKVGNMTTEEAAREWEQSKHKAITPERK